MRRFLRKSFVVGIAVVILVGATLFGWIMRASVAQQEDRNRRTAANAELLKDIAADRGPKLAPPASRSRPADPSKFKTVTVPMVRPVIEESIVEESDGSKKVVQTTRMVTEYVEKQVSVDSDGTVQEFPLNQLLENEKLKAIQAVVADLVIQYIQTNDEKLRNLLVEQLNQYSTEQFEKYQKQREEELKTLEGKVHKLRELHDRREKEKKEIIGDRVRGLLRNADGLGWGNGTTQANPSYVQSLTVTSNPGILKFEAPIATQKNETTSANGSTFREAPAPRRVIQIHERGLSQLPTPANTPTQPNPFPLDDSTSNPTPKENSVSKLSKELNAIGDELEGLRNKQTERLKEYNEAIRNSDARGNAGGAVPFNVQRLEADGSVTHLDGQIYSRKLPGHSNETNPRLDDSSQPALTSPPSTTATVPRRRFPSPRPEAGWKPANNDPLERLGNRLNEMAWKILDSNEPEKRDLDLALKLAIEANEAAGGQDANILDTLARAYYEKKDLEKAVEYQRKAVDLTAAPNSEYPNKREAFQEALIKYTEESSAGRGRLLEPVK